MPESNARYHSLDTAAAYEEKIRTRRRFSTWLEFRMVRRALTFSRGGRVLDCPCGTGRIDDLLREKFSDVTGVDGAEAMFEVYLSGNPQRKGQVGDIFDLPFEDNSFDWVISHRLFHHFKTHSDRTRLLQSLKRVSKGGFCFYCWLEVPLSSRGRNPDRSRQTISRADLDQVIRDAGLKTETIIYAAWPFSPKAMVVCRPQ